MAIMYDQIIEDMNNVMNKSNVKVVVPVIEYEGQKYSLTSREVNTQEGLSNAIDDGIEFILFTGPKAQSAITKIKLRKFINNHKFIMAMAAGVAGAMTAGVGGFAAVALLTGLGLKVAPHKLAKYDYDVKAVDALALTICEEDIMDRIKCSKMVSDHKERTKGTKKSTSNKKK